MPNAIVFGATSGIGLQLTKILVGDGYKVAITGRRLKLLEEIEQSNPSGLIIKQHDVRDVAQSETVFRELVKELEVVDLIIHSSGV